MTAQSTFGDDGARLRRLEWRSRRGLLECDLLIARFFESSRLEDFTPRQLDAWRDLMDLDDPALLELLLGRREPEGALNRDEVRTVLDAMRTKATPA
jgi:antitoxin CptB